MEHKSECKCFACTEGIENYDKWEAEQIKKYGWFMHYVFNDDDYPMDVNIHTHGLDVKYNRMDLQIVVPISKEDANEIFWIMVEKIIKGSKFEPLKDNIDEDFYEIIAEYPIRLRYSNETDRVVVRIIFPDKNGNFDSPFAKKQLEEVLDYEHSS